MNLMLSVMILVISGLGDVLRNTESAENLEETDQNVFDDEPNIGNKNPFPLKPVDTNRILEAFSLWRTLIKTVMEVRKVLEDKAEEKDMKMRLLKRSFSTTQLRR